MKALIIHGGWEGHTPTATAALLAERLGEAGFDLESSQTLDTLLDRRKLRSLDLIVPHWTMGTISNAQARALSSAVRSGVGLAGVHGGMCDSFRGCIDYQWLTGGQFLGHPHVGQYFVRLTAGRSPITRGMKKRFKYDSEQYYMMVDPGVTVLAETTYRFDGRKVTMPVVWTKLWGQGRVFYSALGHTAQELRAYPEVLAMTVRGMVWAAAGKAPARGTRRGRSPS